MKTVITILILAVLGAGGYYGYQKYYSSKSGTIPDQYHYSQPNMPAKEAPKLVTTTEKTATTTAATSDKGTIEGAFSYPSEGIPQGMKACAENQSDKKQYCTDGVIPQTQGAVTFKIEAPPGEYKVFATVPAMPNYRAYYDEFVRCGIKVECTDYTPIVIELAAGATVGDIQPWDWYYQGEK